MNLERVVTRIEEELDEKDEVREVALKSSRAIVRLSGQVLKGLHREEDIREGLNELRDEVSRLSSLIADHPEMSTAGFVEDAFQEFCEVLIIMTILEKDDVPLPEDMNLPSVPYLLGLADSVGELRRFCLDELKRANVVRANYFLDRMEDIFTALMRFDYPDAIAPVRRKQDVARSLLEKTRGEVAVAASTRALEKKLDEMMRRS